MSAEQPSPVNKGSGLRVLLAVLIGLAIAAAGITFVFQGPGPRAAHGASTIVFFPKGSSLNDMARQLKTQHLIYSDLAFRLAAKFAHADRSVRSGEYEIKSGASTLQVLAKIKSGDTIKHALTVPEGRTSAQVLRLLTESGLLDGPAPSIDEGVLMPETYQVERGEARAAVLAQMMRAQSAFLDKAWAERQGDLPLRTKQEALVLASVVERETGLAQERPKVAAVFENRLKKGMKLESDPTTIYAVSRGESLGRGLKMSELKAVNDWNTYAISGLPKTPICNPGREAIVAVLHPAKSDALYFVADGSGGHAFASSFEAHKKNVEKWRRLQNQR